MRKVRALAALTSVAVAVLALAAPASAGAPPCANATTLPGQAAERVLAKATVCLLNRERTRRRMRGLRINRRLSRAALAHTQDMVEKRYFEHVSK